MVPSSSKRSLAGPTKFSTVRWNGSLPSLICSLGWLTKGMLHWKLFLNGKVDLIECKQLHWNGSFLVQFSSSLGWPWGICHLGCHKRCATYPRMAHKKACDLGVVSSRSQRASYVGMARLVSSKFFRWVVQKLCMLPWHGSFLF